MSFPLLKKSDVNGENTNEVFKFIKPKAKGLLGERVNWNFSKFLVSKVRQPSSRRSRHSRTTLRPVLTLHELLQNGEVLHRYAPTTKPDALAKDIEKALAA